MLRTYTNGSLHSFPVLFTQRDNRVFRLKADFQLRVFLRTSTHVKL
jgi:hypothetical protein